MFVLDTNVVSELRRIGIGRATASVVRWTIDHDLSDACVSAVTIKELELGVLLMERKDPAQGLVLRRWLEGDVLPRFGPRILDVTHAVARAAARFHVPRTAPENDAYIAATALVHGMAVATRNVGDFRRFAGVVVVNPWEYAGRGTES
jgi:predicted nucleic acid-binding protein